jgi:hypothetical protein
LSSNLAYQFSQFAFFAIPFVCIWHGWFAFGDAFPAFCACQLNVQLDEGQLVGGQVFFCKNSVSGAFWDADSAVYAFIGVDDQHIGAFAEAIDGAYIHTIGVFAFDAIFGNDVGHGVMEAVGADDLKIHDFKGFRNQGGKALTAKRAGRGSENSQFLCGQLTFCIGIHSFKRWLGLH